MALAKKHQVDLKLVETPPGPPVLATLVAEVKGKEGVSYDQLIGAAAKLKKIMATEPGVVDIDDSSTAERTRVDFVLDKEKASLHGVSTSQIIGTLRLASPAKPRLPSTCPMSASR
jgi:multidrug efflux pump subunit AcrB